MEVLICTIFEIGYEIAVLLNTYIIRFVSVDEPELLETVKVTV